MHLAISSAVEVLTHRKAQFKLQEPLEEAFETVERSPAGFERNKLWQHPLDGSA